MSYVVCLIGAVAELLGSPSEASRGASAILVCGTAGRPAAAMIPAMERDHQFCPRSCLSTGPSTSIRLMIYRDYIVSKAALYNLRTDLHHPRPPLQSTNVRASSTVPSCGMAI